MATNVHARTDRGNGGRPASAPNGRRWGADGKSDPIGRYLQDQLHLAPKTIVNRVRSLPHECAAVIHAFKQLGDEDRLARFLEPIYRAIDGREPPPNVEATWTAAQHADAIEDVDELRYQLDRSDANLAKLIKSKRETISRETALLDTLLEEQRQRAGQHS